MINNEYKSTKTTSRNRDTKTRKGTGKNVDQ